MPRLLAISLLLLFSACTLPQSTEPPLAPLPPAPATAEDVQHLQQAVAGVQQQLDTLEERMRQSDQRIAEQASQLQTLLTLPKGQARPRKGAPAPSPLQIVEQAQREAAVVPSERGYYGRSGEQVYVYQPGRIYTIYLSPWHPTVLSLEPGERLSIGFMLDKETFDVVNKVVGDEARAYSAIAIRPLFDTGTAEGFLVTESGRRYLFHFVIGAKGMVAATFETPQITRTPEPRLVLPRPQS